MVHLREGYLSDSNIKKICPEHQPIPMNRLDLLPTPMRDRSGMYSRPLKQPKIISRPDTAHTMLQATQNLTGRDLTIDYKKAIAKEQKMPVYPEVLPQLTSGEVTPIYGSQVSTGTTLSNLTYTALLQAAQTAAAPTAAPTAAPPPTAVVGAPSTAVAGPSTSAPSTAKVLPKATAKLVSDKLALAARLGTGAMRKADMVKEAAKYGLVQSGNKSDLQSRLEKFVASPDVPKSKSKTTSSGLSSQITQIAKQKSKEILVPSSKEPIPGSPQAPEID